MTQSGAEERAANGAEGRRESSGQPAQPPPTPADANDAATATGPPPPQTDLAAVYAQMHEAFKAGGADASSTSSLRRWYRTPTDADYRDDPAAAALAAATATATPTGRCFPRLYRDPPHSLGQHCTRLVFLRLSDDARVREVAEEAAREVMRATSLPTEQADDEEEQHAATIPPDHYLVGLHELHVSVFHVSHPTSVCGCAVGLNPPRPAASSSGAEELAPPAAVLTPAEWQREGEACIRAVREVAARRPAACLVLERVAVARSGTLLLMWGEAEDWGEEEEQGGGVAVAPTPPPPTLSPVAELRAVLRRALPGASPKQPDIIHTTVLRLLGRAGDGDPSLFYDDDDGGGQQRQRVAEAAERLTAKWRGRVRVPLFAGEDRLRLASEDRFGTVGPETQMLPVR